MPLENRFLVADYTSDQTITVPSSLARGKDYYVYLVFEGEQSSKVVVSENSTYPDGYTANNSRKIGGFIRYVRMLVRLMDILYRAIVQGIFYPPQFGV
ncbi:hypothetical protein NPX99_06455 [Bartonella sp. 220]|uniref:phage major tropism determinant n=1 Tax=Bartonella sp. 220B TaxID=2967260 RepID=UPI0022A95EA7|nr:hypothetical protein [Bartonella sp. 220B]MCZ2158909.1 hypothetical protein [Bartonella sp. 220B]